MLRYDRWAPGFRLGFASLRPDNRQPSTTLLNVFCFILVVLLLNPGLGLSSEGPTSTKEPEKPKIITPEDMGGAMMRQASKVKEDFEKKARALFEREPLGWDLQTVEHLYKAILSMPLAIPKYTRLVVEQSRMLGVVGSLLVLFFVLVLLYSLLGQIRVLRWAEKKFQPLGERIPENQYPYFLSLLKVIVSALIPLVLLGLFSLINAMIAYRVAWFELTGELIGLWAVGALILRLLKEVLTRDLFEATTKYGKPIFRYARLILFYALIGIATFRATKAFQISPEALAFLHFVLSVSVVTALSLFFLKRSAFLSFLGELPSQNYRLFLRFLKTYYYPLLIISYFAALFWCFGYRELGRLILFKIWFTLGAFLSVILLYHAISNLIGRWARKRDPADEAAQILVRSLRSVLLYGTILLALIVVLNLLGLLNPLQRIMSFPMFQLGTTQVTFWIIIKAVLILLAFVFVSRVLQAYLDYEVYPALGIDPGLGYALNTFLKYLSLSIGFLISIRVVGIDLRVLLVFAGAAGIGIGLGLQTMAANIFSGFSIIFGGKIRKGDWIEVGQTLGTVTDIYLRATRIRTRDNIEYLIPNSNLISNTVVNYSLSSPLIRIGLPVGVSYNADPRVVERILVEAAEKEPLVSKDQRPSVRFVGYGESSIDFELLIWIDVRVVPRRKVRSELYFAIFEEFKKVGIEIPFPQRDIHIRSKAE